MRNDVFFVTDIADPGGIDPDLTLEKKPVPKTGITPYFLNTPLSTDILIMQ